MKYNFKIIYINSDKLLINIFKSKLIYSKIEANLSIFRYKY